MGVHTNCIRKLDRMNLHFYWFNVDSLQHNFYFTSNQQNRRHRKESSMNGLLFFLSTLGVFHGIGLSLYLFFFTKHKTLSKYLIGALIFALSIRIGKSVLLYFDRDLPKIYLQIGLSACLFIGPFLYFYLRSVLDKVKVMPKSWKMILLGLLVFIIVIGSIRPYHVDPVFWNEYVVQIIYTIWFFGVLASGYILVPIFRKGISSMKHVTAAEKWLSTIYFGNVIIAAAFFMSFFGFSGAYYISGPLVFSFFLYILAYGYFNNQRFENPQQGTQEKYANKKINAVEADALLAKLDQLMLTKSIYKNSQLKLNEVATELEIPKHQLSQLLNDNLGKSFKTFINEYRINAACQILGTDHQLSLEGIGYEVGFRSKSTFFTTFKKLKQITPAQYQQTIKAKQHQNGSIL